MSPISIAAAALAAICLSSVAQTIPAVARISSVSGDATLASAESAAFTVTRGYLLNPGDRVDTRGGGRVVIDFSDGSMVIVQPGTLLSIKDFRAAASVRELFDIILGTVRVKIQHLTGKPNPYRMSTPTASIAVRGTEFNVIVGADSGTKVEVFEGAVEVGSLSEPENRAVVEAGAAVLVMPGQPMQFYAVSMLAARAPGPPSQRPGPDRLRDGMQQMARGAPPPAPTQVAGAHPEIDERGPMVPHMVAQPQPHGTERDQPAAAGAYERYVAALTSVDYLPLISRFNAFADVHSDTFENPAYGSLARTPEARLFFAPVHTGAEYAILPQASWIQPVTNSVVIGGGVSRANMLGSDAPGTAFASYTAFTSARIGRSGIGFSIDRVSGSGESGLTQLRLTAGVRREFGYGHQAGLFFRYGTLNGLPLSPPQPPAAGNSAHALGHTSEAGLRMRGPLARNVWYGATASIALLSLSRNGVPSSSYGSASRFLSAFGVAYAPDRRTILAIDASGGAVRRDDSRTENNALLQQGSMRAQFASIHAGLQRDVTKHLYLTGSMLGIWRSNRMDLALYSDRFGRLASSASALFPTWNDGLIEPRYVEVGAGWRVSSAFAVQYLFGGGPVTHTLALRYTFRPHE